MCNWTPSNDRTFVANWPTLEWKFSGLKQGCIFRLTCSHSELTKDHLLTSAYVKIFRTVTRNAVNKSVWRKKDCSWLPLNKHAMNILLSSLRIRAHLIWRTGKRLHVLHVLPSRMVGWNELCSPDLKTTTIIQTSWSSFTGRCLTWRQQGTAHSSLSSTTLSLGVTPGWSRLLSSSSWSLQTSSWSPTQSH